MHIICCFLIPSEWETIPLLRSPPPLSIGHLLSISYRHLHGANVQLQSSILRLLHSLFSTGCISYNHLPYKLFFNFEQETKPWDLNAPKQKRRFSNADEYLSSYDCRVFIKRFSKLPVRMRCSERTNWLRLASNNSHYSNISSTVHKVRMVRTVCCELSWLADSSARDILSSACVISNVG